MSTYTAGQIQVLLAGSNIWAKRMEEAVERKVGKTQAQAAEPSKPKPPKPFKKMTSKEYKSWQVGMPGKM